MSATRPASALDIAQDLGSGYPDPFPKGLPGSSCRKLGDHFGLSQFGVSFNTLVPGDQSGLRHWHSQEEELIFVLEGELMLQLDDGEHRLQAGMCAGFRGGERRAHLLRNRGEAPARYLIIGGRIRGDVAFYPDDDLAWLETPEGTVAIHKDGRRY
ncbi:cupin domain-containing protein [Niveibacterium sp. SC-1]|uniref:cupin domain-containing protein n=1 Tax=Niveibacterium sp. SC-1 TaxID=3135646 RepID=UPI00311F6020